MMVVDLMQLLHYKNFTRFAIISQVVYMKPDSRVKLLNIAYHNVEHDMASNHHALNTTLSMIGFNSVKCQLGCQVNYIQYVKYFK